MVALRATWLVIGMGVCSAQQDAFGLPGKDKIEKLVCKFASKKQIEDKATDEICDLIGKKVKIPDCQKVLDFAWDKIITKCPQTVEFPMPSKDQIEKLACELASKKQIEDKATEEVCTLIGKKMKIPDCQQALELLWGKIEAKCPKTVDFPMPNKDQIEKLACELASKKQIEDKATEEVCTLIGKKMKIPDCQKALELLWEKIEAKCPKGNLMAVAEARGASIFEFGCEVLTTAALENVASQVCSERLIRWHNSTFELCEGAVQVFMDDYHSKCHGTTTAAPSSKAADPSDRKQEEQFACEVASLMTLQSSTNHLCSKTPLGKLPECSALLQTLVQKEFGDYKSKCNLGPKPYFPMPDVSKLACGILPGMQIDAEGTCQDPKLQKIPDCEAKVTAAWNKIKSGLMNICDNGPPSVSDIEKFVCKVATQKDLEEKAVPKICALVEKKAGKKIPNCQKIVELGWDKLAEKCPKASTIVV